MSAWRGVSRARAPGRCSRWAQNSSERGGWAVAPSGWPSGRSLAAPGRLALFTARTRLRER